MRKTMIAMGFSALAAMSAAPAYADVSVGVLMPTSGFAAGFGKEEEGSIALFLKKYGDDLGAAGKLKLIIYDTRGEPAQAISLTKKLIDTDKVAVIIGPYLSGESEAAFPVANRAKTFDHHPLLRQARHRRREPALGVPLRVDHRQDRQGVHRSLAEEAGQADQERGDLLRRQGCGLEHRRQARDARRAQGQRHQHPRLRSRSRPATSISPLR